MKKLYLFLILCLSSLLFMACSSDDKNTDKTPKEISDKDPNEILTDGIETKLVQNGDYSFTYTVSNTSEEEKTFNFPNTQRYDYAIHNKNNESTLLFSSFTTFGQMIGTETLKPGETLTYEFDLSHHKLEKGDYTLEVWFTPLGAIDSFKNSTQYTIN